MILRTTIINHSCFKIGYFYFIAHHTLDKNHPPIKLKLTRNFRRGDYYIIHQKNNGNHRGNTQLG